MCYYIPSCKTKGIWIVITCSFMSLFYIAHQLNGATFSKPFALIEIVNGNKALIEVSRLQNDAKGRINLRTNKIALDQEIPFTGLTKDSLNDVNTQAKTTQESYISKTIIGNMSLGISESHMSDTENLSNITEVTQNRKLKIGILIPASTRKLKNPVLEKLSLITLCLPSINKTIEAEYIYVLYVGIDKGDYLESVKDELKTKFNQIKTVVTLGGTFTKAVNAIAREAYKDGMDYLVRINDDSSFETKNWTSNGISVLQHYDPPNIGVVGPTCKEGNTAILTHDMVHRTHIEIFDFYYPPYFDNWWADDWITKVYSTKRSTKLTKWVVKHHLKSHGTRYKVDFKKEIRLNKTLTFDQERLSEYLSNLKN